MGYRPLDTSLQANVRQREIINAHSPDERAHMLDSLCAGVTEMAIAGIRQKQPDATSGEVMIDLMVRRYGRDFVDALPADTIADIKRAQDS